MLVDLTHEFLTVTTAADPVDAYRRYFEDHRPILDAYWRNYILDPEGPQADEIIRRAVHASRPDLTQLLGQVDVGALADEAMQHCEELFEVDQPFDLYLMVGVGGANAGELVVGGRGIAFVCLEHFTGRPNAETFGLGLDPRTLPLWIAHEIAHLVRYTSPASRADMARLIWEAGGYYDYWRSGSDATLRELLVNEGLAVAASRLVAPGFDAHEYLGYSAGQYRRLRELEAFLRQAVNAEVDCRGLGYRLRYLSGGVNTSAREIGGKVMPERAGYYLGWRMVEPFVASHGISASLRASAEDCWGMDHEMTEAQPA